MPLTQVDQGLLNQFAQYTGFKNRIINGGMVIDQRNAGASVTSAGLAAAGQAYFIDRWRQDSTLNASFTYQQNAGSVTPPTGFTNYVGATSTAAYSPGTNTTHRIGQPIEGFNVADLAWGTANAQSVTLSFWVRSSLTGTQSGSLSNNGGTRSYVYSFAVSAANTWEYKTVTIPGDTTGTWLTNNGTGLIVGFNLGTGTGTFGTTTANTWQAGNLVGLTSAVQVSATNGATFYITGVQLEKGSTATSFDFRPYGTELMLCQRYYIRYATNGMYFANGHLNATTQYDVMGTFPVTMRAAPTGTALNVGNIQIKLTGGSNQSITNVTAFATNVFSFRAYGDMPSASATGYGCFLYSNADGRGFEFSAEL